MKVRAPTHGKVSSPDSVWVQAMEGADGNETEELTTRDICAGGAFVLTECPLEIGTEVHIDFILDLEELRRIKDRRRQ